MMAKDLHHDLVLSLTLLLYF